jgi:uncharacterized protein YqgC (DUF456 family)
VLASFSEFTLCLLAVLVNAVGVVLTLMQLPGNWLIVLATALVAWWGWSPVPDDRLVGWATLVALLAIALAAEVAEFAYAALGTKRAGGSRKGAAYAVAGGIVGAIAGSFVIPVLIVGTVAGAAIGSALGAYAGDRAAGRDWQQAARAARGAAVGRLTATAVKSLAGLVLWIVALVGLVF